MRDIVNVFITKLDENTVIPKYSIDGDAAMDVVAISKTETDDYIEYDTGLAFEVPEGYYMDIRPRSSISKYDLVMCNAPGTLDSNYRGPLKVRFKRVKHYNPARAMFGTMDIAILGGSSKKEYEVGDRVAQIMVKPYPHIIFTELRTLSDTERGDGGFGSTGK
jgi:dUTP pyrophosphatase